MTAAALDAQRLYGAWELVSWRRLGPDGAEHFPHGREARGRLIYEPSRRMAVFLMRPDWADPAVTDGFIAYSGRFETRAGEIRHLIDMASQKAIIGVPQVRKATLQGAALRLEAPGREGPGTWHVLDWRRAEG